MTTQEGIKGFNGALKGEAFPTKQGALYSPRLPEEGPQQEVQLVVALGPREQKPLQRRVQARSHQHLCTMGWTEGRSWGPGCQSPGKATVFSDYQPQLILSVRHQGPCN